MNKIQITLGQKPLDLKALKPVVYGESVEVRLNTRTLEKTEKIRALLKKLAATKPVYGYNTGFGPMASFLIPNKDVLTLQKNLVLSHASGMGKAIPVNLARLIMIVRLNTLAKGTSGVSGKLLTALANFINSGAVPYIPKYGSVGASGDLVQLSHIALALMGEGKSWDGKTYKNTSIVFKQLKLRPHVYGGKEALSIINGTAAMTGIGSAVVLEAQQLLKIATANASLALDVTGGYTDPLEPALHKLRGQSGQIAIANKMRTRLNGSTSTKIWSNIAENPSLQESVSNTTDGKPIQDVYSLRCTPQILGPIYETIANATKIVSRELNASTDNPIIDPSSGKLLHGGNFHGDYVATAMDQLKAGVIKMALLSERRINYFLSRHVNQHFPPFLNLEKPGLSLALQGMQFTATSTAARLQSMAFPHTVHTIPTNADNQDIVSMGTDSAMLAYSCLKLVANLLAMELAVLSQAACFTQMDQLSKTNRLYIAKVREILSPVTTDRPLTDELNKLSESLWKMEI